LTDLAPPRAFARMFSSAILIQALLSAANLLISLILIRRASDADYGYFVLITNSLLLLTSLQGAFIQPSMVMRMTQTDALGRGRLIGGLAHAQGRVLAGLAAALILAITLALFTGFATPHVALLLGVALGAALAALFREFFRISLLAYRRPNDVLRADFVFVALFVVGAYASTFTPLPAVGATFSLGIAALVGGHVLSRALQRYEPWVRTNNPGLLRSLAPIGAWSAAGAITHWAFSQGYNYVAVGTLDVTAVAALAATRLTMMPVNLMSAGIASLMMATASAWLNQHGAAAVFHRLSRVAGGLCLAALAYMVLLWLLRDWIFTEVMGKDFPQRDELLLCWSAVFLVAVFRDQLLYLPGASGRFRPMAFITLISALLSLAITYVALGQFGVIGAPIGVLTGEVANLLGILALSAREIRRERATAGRPV
jgi:O-antigen/teichoic acid export membrane protein